MMEKEGGNDLAAGNPVLVIGVGNAYRSDDAAGLMAASQIREKNLPEVEVVEESGEGAYLMELWKNRDTVILFDTFRSESEPGTIHRFEAGAQNVPKDFFHYSTHLFGVAEAIELARALDRLPPRLIVYGIKGENYSMGPELSPEVEKAVPEAVRLAMEDVRKMRTPKQSALN
ncbi:MAG: hydrogenase maturation protease [Bacillota bacterium]